MPSEYDATEFVDDDFRTSSKAAYPGTPGPAATGASASVPGARAPSREEVDSRVSETQQKLAELKRVQEDLERERAALEETRRRQMEFQTGRQEMIQSLTRGIGLLAEAEFASRRDAEQMARSLIDMQSALVKVEATNEQSWTRENFATELTRALTAIENARMEWNGARLKFPVLSGEDQAVAGKSPQANPAPQWLASQSLGDLCKVGLALTWPLALVALCIGLLLVFVRR